MRTSFPHQWWYYQHDICTILLYFPIKSQPRITSHCVSHQQLSCYIEPAVNKSFPELMTRSMPFPLIITLTWPRWNKIYISTSLTRTHTPRTYENTTFFKTWLLYWNSVNTFITYYACEHNSHIIDDIINVTSVLNFYTFQLYHSHVSPLIAFLTNSGHDTLKQQ